MKTNSLERMQDLIMLDFSVDILYKSQDQMLYYKSDNAFLKFVLDQIKNPGDSYTQLSQFYILRYEIANCLCNFLVSNKANNSFTLTTGVKVDFRINNELIELSLKPEESPLAITISSDNKDFYEIIDSDYAVLKSIKSNSPNDLIMEFWKILRFDRNNSQISETITVTDLEILQFERKILSSTNKINCLTSIYRLMLKPENINIEWMKDLLMENFEWTYNTTHCDCGSDGCFFPILKENLQYFFTNNYIKDGEFENNLVLSDFDDFWNKLPLKYKTALGFLYSEFQNSTLLNLAFIKPDFSLNRYLFLMCYPYQPDSEDEDWVRTISNLTHIFIQYSK